MTTRKNKQKASQAVLVLCIAGLLIASGSASIAEVTRNEHQPSPLNRSTTIYVDDDNTAGPWNGTLEYPYQFIQDGIDHAACSDVVYVFNGTYYENIVIPISLELCGEHKDITIIDGGLYGTVVNIYADGVTVTGFTVTRCGTNLNNAGIRLHSSYNTIMENIISDNDNYGIRVLASDNTMYHNNFYDNLYQASDESGGNDWDAGADGGNYWSDYNGTDDDEDGIGDLPYATGTSSSDDYPLIHPYGWVTNQNTSEIFLTIQDAICDGDTLDTHVIFAKNDVYPEHITICKDLLVYGEDYRDTIIDGRGTGDVITVCADNATVQNFDVRNSGSEEQNAGILITADHVYILNSLIHHHFHGLRITDDCEHTLIYRNIIKDNSWNGMTLQPGCTWTKIYENTMSDNFNAGIGVAEASTNYIYHNNFLENRYHAYDDGINVWDDGYPSGGNYWDDYTGVDANGDGIGDTPYDIPQGINQDRYPLMAPYSGEDTTPPVLTVLSPLNGVYLRNLRLFSRILRQHTILLGDLTIEAEATDVGSGIAKVEFYIDDIMNPDFIDTQEPYSWTWEKASLLKHRHTITIIAYDNAGNTDVAMINVLRFL
ncbi:MAG: right-handed parallel beta-helix repeat-containing protein [Candidatus Thermoplasmatota archaeon]|nr:right-handed parallel beta-helix repeat-containing protein [Candidatus Thermoplasmatota archaeon]